MNSDKPQILLTNDDGVASPGLWAAAVALTELGRVWVVAPRQQSTSAGRSHPVASDGSITVFEQTVNDEVWKAYAVNGSPAQCVHYAVQEILPVRPDLVVSGINYGANVGVDITRSGTIGAALEAANYGIPALAVSLETGVEHTFSHSEEVDFSTAAYFSAYFARFCLLGSLGADVQVLKVEVPASATPQTAWEVAPLARMSLYLPTAKKRLRLEEPGRLDWQIQPDLSIFPSNTDAYTVFVKKQVAVTPLSMDLTSRVALADLDQKLRNFARP
jgi:5'-nucleotidase